MTTTTTNQAGAERRTSYSPPRVESRADGAAILTGYGAVFYDPGDPGTQFWIFPDLVERIMPTAFNAAIAEQDDVRCLKNHDPNLILGRTRSSTLTLSIDKAGLFYECELPQTTVGKDLATEIGRGDVSGSSFGFSVRKRRGKVVYAQETVDGKTYEVREIHECELFDVSPVTYPAYEATSSAVREDRSAIADERAAFRRTLRKGPSMALLSGMINICNEGARRAKAGR